MLDDLVRDAGVHTLLHTQVVAPIAEADKVAGVLVEGRSGRQALKAGVVIDAGADGLVARAAGARALNSDQPRDELQPMTLMLRLGEVDVDRFRSLERDEKQRLSRLGMQTGELNQRLLSLISAPTGGDAFVLMTRVSGYDGADSASLSEAEFEGRRQARTLLPFLQREVPGFERCRLITIAPWIGIRETWQIAGDYVLTGEDVLAGRQFSDGIALGGGPLDLRHPVGGDLTLMEPAQPFATPYRSLLPAGVENMLVTGRCISATIEAHRTIRHMGSAMCLGQAAGVAAALAVSRNESLRALDPQLVRAALRGQNAIVDLDEPQYPIHSTRIEDQSPWASLIKEHQGEGIAALATQRGLAKDKQKHSTTTRAWVLSRCGTPNLTSGRSTESVRIEPPSLFSDIMLLKSQTST